MIKPDFDITFDKLVAAIPTKRDNIEGTRAVFWDRFKGHTSFKFQQAVDILIDKEQYFPSVAKVVAALKECYKESLGTKEYAHCPACNPQGHVGMLISFKFEDEDGQKVRKIKDRYYWKIGLAKQLKEETGEDYYDVSYFCRCEKGNDLFVTGGSRYGSQITWEMFEELKGA